MSAALALLFVAAPASAASRTATFEFEDARFLRSVDHDGGLVYEPAPSSDTLPLLVFLHGVNESGPLHRGLGPGAFDLRSLADDLATQSLTTSFVVAGPSQNKEAWTGSRLWAGFDLDAFVSAAEAALPSGGRIDRARIVVAGHSGAGCNTTGGILAPEGKIKPLATLALDTCMDEDFGKLLGEAAQRSPVHVFYQTALWPRDVDAFTKAFQSACGDHPAFIEKLDVSSANPHEDLAPIALRQVLPKLLPKEADDS
jgi:hypothetical protein